MIELSTYYVPEGSQRTLTVPTLRIGSNESDILLADDRGTLLMPCYVEEAEHDGMLLLKQYGAARLIERIRMLEEYEGLEPGDQLVIRRDEAGNYDVDLASVKDIDEAM